MVIEFFNIVTKFIKKNLLTLFYYSAKRVFPSYFWDYLKSNKFISFKGLVFLWRKRSRLLTMQYFYIFRLFLFILRSLKNIIKRNFKTYLFRFGWFLIDTVEFLKRLFWKTIFFFFLGWILVILDSIVFLVRFIRRYKRYLKFVFKSEENKDIFYYFWLESALYDIFNPFFEIRLPSLFMGPDDSLYINADNWRTFNQFKIVRILIIYFDFYYPKKVIFIDFCNLLYEILKILSEIFNLIYEIISHYVNIKYEIYKKKFDEKREIWLTHYFFIRKILTTSFLLNEILKFISRKILNLNFIIWLRKFKMINNWENSLKFHLKEIKDNKKFDNKIKELGLNTHLWNSKLINKDERDEFLNQLKNREKWNLNLIKAPSIENYRHGIFKKRWNKYDLYQIDISVLDKKEFDIKLYIEEKQKIKVKLKKWTKYVEKGFSLYLWYSVWLSNRFMNFRFFFNEKYIYFKYWLEMYYLFWNNLDNKIEGRFLVLDHILNDWYLNPLNYLRTLLQKFKGFKHFNITFAFSWWSHFMKIFADSTFRKQEFFWYFSLNFEKWEQAHNIIFRWKLFDKPLNSIFVNYTQKFPVNIVDYYADWLRRKYMETDKPLYRKISIIKRDSFHFFPFFFFKKMSLMFTKHWNFTQFKYSTWLNFELENHLNISQPKLLNKLLWADLPEILKSIFQINPFISDVDHIIKGTDFWKQKKMIGMFISTDFWFKERKEDIIEKLTLLLYKEPYSYYQTIKYIWRYIEYLKPFFYLKYFQYKRPFSRYAYRKNVLRFTLFAHRKPYFSLFVLIYRFFVKKCLVSKDIKDDLISFEKNMDFMFETISRTKLFFIKNLTNNNYLNFFIKKHIMDNRILNKKRSFKDIFIKKNLFKRFYIYIHKKIYFYKYIKERIKKFKK